jgi:hypothetical protein
MDSPWQGVNCRALSRSSMQLTFDRKADSLPQLVSIFHRRVRRAHSALKFGCIKRWCLRLSGAPDTWKPPFPACNYFYFHQHSRFIDLSPLFSRTFQLYSGLWKTDPFFHRHSSIVASFLRSPFSVFLPGIDFLSTIN